MVPFKVVNHRILKEDLDNGTYFDFCEEIAVTKVMTDILTGRKSVEVEIYASTGRQTVVLPRRAISKTIVTDLADYGLTLPDTPDSAADVQFILYESEQVAAQEFVHHRLGFNNVDGKLVFLANTPIGLSDPAKATSSFANPVVSRPVGTFESWHQFIEVEVIGRNPPELALALGVSAPVTFLLRKAKVITGNPLWALIGKTSIGKTTMLRLIASIYGNPDESVGLIDDFNSTELAFYESLSANQGLPAIFDEATQQPRWDFSGAIYSIPKGKSRKRCKSEGGLVPAKHFTGAVIISGEKSLFEQTSKNEGLYARLVEFSLRWLESPEHAKRLAEGCLNNYGTAVYPLIEWLLAHQTDLPKAYQQEYQKFRQLSSVSTGVDDRLMKLYALITTSAKVARSALKLNIDVKAMRELLLSIHQQNLPKLDREEAVYASLQASVAGNGAKFLMANPTAPDGFDMKNAWGEYDSFNGAPCVWIIDRHFRRFMEEANASVSERALLHELRRKGWLAYFSDRFAKAHRIGKTYPVCYCLLLPGIPTPPKIQQRPSSPNRKRLLEDEDEGEKL